MAWEVVAWEVSRSVIAGVLLDADFLVERGRAHTLRWLDRRALSVGLGLPAIHRAIPPDSAKARMPRFSKRRTGAIRKA